MAAASCGGEEAQVVKSRENKRGGKTVSVFVS